MTVLAAPSRPDPVPLGVRLGVGDVAPQAPLPGFVVLGRFHSQFGFEFMVRSRRRREPFFAAVWASEANRR